MAGTNGKIDLASVGAGAAVIIGLLAAVGVSGDLLERMVRNQPWSYLPVAGAVLAALLLLVPVHREIVRTVAIPLFAVSLLAAGFLGVRSLAEREQPQLSIALKHGAKGLPFVLDVKASATSLRSGESMLLRVIALKKGVKPDLASIEAVCNTPQFADSRKVSILSWTETGPNLKGEAKAELSMDAPTGSSFYCAYAALRNRQGTNVLHTARHNWAVLRA